MQIILIKHLLAETESRSQGLIPYRNSKCLVAIEQDKLIAIVLLKPNNRRGTCWSITNPEFINEPKETSKYNICKMLLKKILCIDNSISQSWIIRCSTTDSQQLSLFRELGFQPLKILKIWNYKHSLPSLTSTDSALPKNLKWQSLKRSNAKLLWRLKKSSESVYLREILNGKWIDLFDKNIAEKGILISDEGRKISGLLGLVSTTCPENLLSLEIIRDTACDNRLNKSSSIILNNLLNRKPYISIETSAEDEFLNNILMENGWQENHESILLGRNLWKRKVKNKLLNSQSSLESILGSLKTNQPPLPSPNLCKNS